MQKELAAQVDNRQGNARISSSRIQFRSRGLGKESSSAIGQIAPSHFLAVTRSQNVQDQLVKLIGHVL